MLCYLLANIVPFSAEPLEYCQFETFRPRCWKNEVILIESAKYGRMKTGKCLKAQADVLALSHDLQYLGCSMDVLENLDWKCTGKTQCDISITDVELGLVNSCYEGLRMYLEASFKCIQGETQPVFLIKLSQLFLVRGTLFTFSSTN